jgi:YidC/Oxa1 family membrane protein insertase
LAIFVLLLVVRSISLLITIRSAIQNEKMQEIQGLIAEINAKYKDLTDMQSRQQKQMEVAAAYKKYNIKPFAAVEQMLITLPIFMIISRLITIVRPMKTVSLFNL